MQRDFLGESHPPTGERPEGVLGGRDGRVDGARSESGAAREQAVIGEIVEGFSQDGRGLHDDLLQRVHRRGARFHGGIPCDLELADHLDGAVRGLGSSVESARRTASIGFLDSTTLTLVSNAGAHTIPDSYLHGDIYEGEIEDVVRVPSQPATDERSLVRRVIVLAPAVGVMVGTADLDA